MIHRYKENSRDIIVSGILSRFNAFTGFQMKTSTINDRLEQLSQDEEVLFTTAWDRFYENPEFFRSDGLHLYEIVSARLGRLLDDVTLSYSKKLQGRNAHESAADSQTVDPTRHTPEPPPGNTAEPGVLRHEALMLRRNYLSCAPTCIC